MLSIKQTGNKEKEAEYGALIKQNANMLKIVMKCIKKNAFYQINFKCKILIAVFIFIWNEIGVLYQYRVQNVAWETINRLLHITIILILLFHLPNYGKFSYFLPHKQYFKSYLWFGNLSKDMK